MAARKNARAAQTKLLPAPGELLAIRLPEGFWGACWTVGPSDLGAPYAHLGDVVVVAAANWFDREPPTPARVQSPSLLHIDVDRYDLPALFNQPDTLPSDVAHVVGRIDAPDPKLRAPW